MNSDDVGTTYPTRNGVHLRRWVDSVGQVRERVRLVRGLGSPHATALDMRKAVPRRLSEFVPLSGIWIFLHDEPRGGGEPEPL